MITHSLYKQMNGGTNTGRVRKQVSEMIIENSFNRDPEYQIGYFYDAPHDVGSERWEYRDMHPTNDSYKIPIELKLQKHTSQTFNKDVVTFHILFKPSQRCCIDYYKESFEERYGSIWPVGLYVDLMDSMDMYHRWLVVGLADSNDFICPTYEVLPCDYVFQWIHDRKKYQCVGVSRTQNSYNSGLWTDYKFTGVEDQHKFCVPLNRETETIYYDKRMIVDAMVLTEPRAWKVSKIERAINRGIAVITLYQDLFNDHTDYIEKNDGGLVVGMWADYFVMNASDPVDDNIVIDEETSSDSDYTATITVSGVSPSLKVGGSYKTFTMKYYNIDGEEIPHNYQWNFKLDGEEVPEGLLDIKYPEDLETLGSNQIKIKFLGEEYYYGSLLQVYNDDCSINIDIVGV